MGSYKNHKNAQKMKSELQAKGYSAKIKTKRNLYVVYIGPFTTLQALHQLANDTHNHSQVIGVEHTKSSQGSGATFTHQSKYLNSKKFEQIPQSTQYGFQDKIKNDSKCKDCQLEDNNWFVQLQGGVVFPFKS